MFTRKMFPSIHIQFIRILFVLFHCCFYDFCLFTTSYFFNYFTQKISCEHRNRQLIFHQRQLIFHPQNFHKKNFMSVKFSAPQVSGEIAENNSPAKNENFPSENGKIPQRKLKISPLYSTYEATSPEES